MLLHHQGIAVHEGNLTMANAPVSPHLTPLPPSNPLKHGTVPNKQVIFSPKHRTLKRSSSLPPLAAGLALPINVDYLRREFSSDGVSFEGIGDSCVVKMRLENGSVASLMLPGGLITSYKPLMWHGGTVEVLHTTVSEGQNGEVVVRGGVSMGLSCAGEGGSTSWSSDKWALLNLRRSAEKYIQLELVSIGPKDMVEAKCLVTLQQDLLGSEIVVTNPGSSSLELSGSVISHLTVSTPDATYAVGLQGSSYHRKQPLVSDFSIVPPDFAEEKTLASWARKGFDGLFPTSWDRGDRNVDDNGDELTEEGEEDDDCAQMTEKMCRIYTNPPRELTIMDRGRRNSVVLRRSGGFDELYVFSPGSDHEWYGKYAYVCVGPSAMLKPVILGPGGVWTGAQYLYNPNL